MKNFWIGFIVFWSFFLVGIYFLAKHFADAQKFDSPKFEGASELIINAPVLAKKGLMPQPNVTDYTFLHFSDSTEFFESCVAAISDAKAQGVKIVREIVFQTDNGHKEISCKDFLKFLDTVPEVKTCTNDSSK